MQGVFYLPAPACCKRTGWRGGGLPSRFRTLKYKLLRGLVVKRVCISLIEANAREFETNIKQNDIKKIKHY